MKRGGAKGNGLFGVRELDAVNEFAAWSYRTRIFDLRPMGIPWIPVVGQTSFAQVNKGTFWHVHRGVVEIIFCNSGTSEYESCGRTYRFAPGRIFLSRPDEPHRQVGIPKGYSNFYLLFKATADRDVQWMAQKLSSLPRLFAGSRGIRRHFSRILNLVESGAGKSADELRVRLRSEVWSLLLEIVDSTSLSMKEAPVGSYREIADRMRNHPEDDYPVKRLAKSCDVSQATFISAFKAFTGFPPHAFLLNCRIAQAKRDLRSGMSVHATADRLSFPSSQHFSTTFKRVVGQAPQKWLRVKSS